ncbi:MAG: CBS domain-containing protein [Usitatibacter sp.]
MFDRPVSSIMQKRKVIKAAPETFVSKAAKLMAAKDVGAIMVVEDDRLIGIVTERDVLFRVVAKGLDAKVTRLADVMTRAPQTVDPDTPFGYALVVMQEKGFRHLPVIQDGKPVGIISSRSAMDPDLQEFTAEIRRREHWKKAR